MRGRLDSKRRPQPNRGELRASAWPPDRCAGAGASHTRGTGPRLPLCMLQPRNLDPSSQIHFLRSGYCPRPTTLRRLPQTGRARLAPLVPPNAAMRANAYPETVAHSHVLAPTNRGSGIRAWPPDSPESVYRVALSVRMWCVAFTCSSFGGTQSTASMEWKAVYVQMDIWYDAWPELTMRVPHCSRERQISNGWKKEAAALHAARRNAADRVDNSEVF
ncbi:hypothetical protein B0H10DRAFT_1948813 [Mycena sp. CBHHK59/15]|nr:hypothetical protein B0H10DRAFT_1948813 [Mycena sp. CBHHK59/15]